MSTIVVGVDGSNDSQRALDWAIGEAAVRQWSLTAVTVVQTPIAIGPGSPIKQPPSADQVHSAEQTARAAVDKSVAASGLTVEVTVRVEYGVAAEQLLEAAATADLLVVGSRGSGGFARLMLGSVSSQIVHHATCPVVVVPTRVRT